MRWHLLLPLLAAATGQAAEPAIELRTDDAVHRGRIFSKDARTCWLTESDGTVVKVRLSDVTDYRKIGSFRPVSTSVLGDRLQREFGREYEVAKTREYVVVAPRGRARQYADALDRVYRTFRLYFRVRRFDVPEPEFPLVAVVFGTREEFVRHCGEVGISASGFSGFYVGGSNRILMYEIDRRSAATTETFGPQPFRTGDGGQVFGSIDAATEGVLIHEATHQLGYNCGLHARLGWNPKWTVEGLATVFEAPGIRERSSSRSQRDRVNPSRLRDFRDFAKSRRRKGSVAELVSSDKRLQYAVSDFYAESWALTFFLVETRPRKYAAYQKAIAGRDPFRRYTAEERLDDFRAAFGDNLEMLDAELLRFVSRID